MRIRVLVRYSLDKGRMYSIILMVAYHVIDGLQRQSLLWGSSQSELYRSGKRAAFSYFLSFFALFSQGLASKSPGLSALESRIVREY
jgi:hypothetical protein